MTKPLAIRRLTIILQALIITAGLGLVITALLSFSGIFTAIQSFPTDYIYIPALLLGAGLVLIVNVMMVMGEAVVLLRFVANGAARSSEAVKSVARTKFYVLASSVIATLALPLLYVWADKADAPGILLIGIVVVITLYAVTVATALLRLLLSRQ